MKYLVVQQHEIRFPNFDSHVMAEGEIVTSEQLGEHEQRLVEEGKVIPQDDSDLLVEAPKSDAPKSRKQRRAEAKAEAEAKVETEVKLEADPEIKL